MDELEHRRRPLPPPSPSDAGVVGATEATATHSKIKLHWILCSKLDGIYSDLSALYWVNSLFKLVNQS